jgi:FKBP-type peptidyl-prolyl cis-trans isomerase SlyD
MALRFWVQVEDIRAATDQEIENRHPEGGETFAFGMPDDELDDGDEELIDGVPSKGGSSPTLH